MPQWRRILIGRINASPGDNADDEGLFVYVNGKSSTQEQTTRKHVKWTGRFTPVFNKTVSKFYRTRGLRAFYYVKRD